MKKLIDEIIDKINPLPSNVYDYTKIKLVPERITDKAVSVISESRQRWIPLSVLRVDNNKEIWIANWFQEREGIYL